MVPTRRSCGGSPAAGLAPTPASGSATPRSNRPSRQGEGLRGRSRLGVGEPGRYVRLSLSPGWTLERRALFLHSQLRQGSGLAQRLGCALLDDGAVQVTELGQTTAAGDLCRTPAMPSPAAQAVMAAA